MKKLFSLLLALLLMCSVLPVCAEEHAPETITILLPNFETIPGAFENMEKEFESLYPWIDMEIILTGWGDYENQLNVMVNAGSPPDITYPTDPTAIIQKYLASEMLLDISSAPAEVLADYDASALEFYRNGDALYGLPFVVSPQTLGGNKEFLEAAGIDWRAVQKNGWTFKEFKEAAAKGVKMNGDETDVYGFVFACSGVTAVDLMELLTRTAGMSNAIDENGKYAYTDPNFLKCLQFVRGMIDAGIMPKESASVDAGMRWNMMLTGDTMMTGKGLINFEILARNNNKLLAETPESAAAGSQYLEYVGLPVPTLEGCEYKSFGTVNGYITFRQMEEPTAEHIQNVVLAANYMATNKYGVEMSTVGLQTPVNATGRSHVAWATEKNAVIADPDNKAFNELTASCIYTPNLAVTAEQAEKVARIREETILPQMQALLAGEITPEAMYDAICKAAVAMFGAEGVR